MTSIIKLLLVAGGAGILMGRREVPKVAQGLGWVLGKSLGFIQRSRAKLHIMNQDSEFYQLQQELRRGVEELNMIKYELQSTSVMTGAPGPTSAVLNATSGKYDNRRNGAPAPTPRAQPSVSPQAPRPQNMALPPDLSEEANSQAAKLVFAELSLNQKGQKGSSDHGADILADFIADRIVLEEINKAERK